jgi:hypothetical protein
VASINWEVAMNIRPLLQWSGRRSFAGFDAALGLSARGDYPIRDRAIQPVNFFAAFDDHIW